MVDERYDRLTLEIDAYIRQYLCSEGLRHISFATDRLDTDATEPSIGGAGWALAFLLKKLEPTFSESLMELIEKKGRTPAEIYTKAGVTKGIYSVDSINEQLCLRGHKLLTNWRKPKDE